MIITIHQPDFLPWLGFFDRWQQSDLFVILDDVQFIRRGWQHRDIIKTPSGKQWLTVPVIKKGRYDQSIRSVEINNQEGWRRRHLNLLTAVYRKAPNFKKTFEALEIILARPYHYLMELNVALLNYCADCLNITTPVCSASDYPTTSRGTERLIHLVKQLKGNGYLTGLGSKDYLEEKQFEAAGIKVYWQHYEPLQYPQLDGSFEPGLSILDFLMMVSNPATLWEKRNKTMCDQNRDLRN